MNTPKSQNPEGRVVVPDEVVARATHAYDVASFVDGQTSKEAFRAALESVWPDYTNMQRRLEELAAEFSDCSRDAVTDESKWPEEKVWLHCAEKLRTLARNAASLRQPLRTRPMTNTPATPTTETQPARMGDDLPDWAIAKAYWEEFTNGSEFEPNEFGHAILLRARELSAHVGGGGGEPQGCVHKFSAYEGRLCLRCGWDFREQRFHPSKEAIATQQPASGEVAPKEVRSWQRGKSFWVIEKFKDSHGGQYWGGNTTWNYTDDISKAVQFCRESDARRAIGHELWRYGESCTNVKIAEHMMIDTTSATPTASPAAGIGEKL